MYCTKQTALSYYCRYVLCNSIGIIFCSKKFSKHIKYEERVHQEINRTALRINIVAWKNKSKKTSSLQSPICVQRLISQKLSDLSIDLFSSIIYIKNNAMQCNAIQCNQRNIMQCHIIPCPTMPSHVMPV